MRDRFAPVRDCTFAYATARLADHDRVEELVEVAPVAPADEITVRTKIAGTVGQ